MPGLWTFKDKYDTLTLVGVRIMIYRISDWIVRYIKRNSEQTINKDEEVFCRYGIEIIVSSVLSFALIFILGIGINMLLETIVFFICFSSLRKYTGGYHADSYIKCNIGFILVFTFTISVSLLLENKIGIFESIVSSFIMIILIWKNSPVEHINKPIADEKKMIYKCMSTAIGFIYCVIGTIMIMYKGKVGPLILCTVMAVVVLIIISKNQKG